MLQFSSPPISTPQAKLNIPDAPMMPIGGFGAAPAAQEVCTLLLFVIVITTLIPGISAQFG